MPAAARTDWTVNMLDALPDDGQRYEIIEGELFVTPAPGCPHQFVLSELHARVHAYLRGSAVGRVLFSPSDVRRDERSRNHTKRTLYLSSGVMEYWVMNSDARNISRWQGRDDPGEVLSRAITWHPADMRQPLDIDIEQLFDEALG